jgi:hypothetical protein
MNWIFQFRPSLEQLDDRTLPSGSFAADGFAAPLGTLDQSLQALPGAPLVQSGPAQQQLLPIGMVHGSWTTKPTLPDAGTIQELQGSGFFPSLGQVQMSGTLHTPGFIREGRTTGTLVLSNARGSITLQLVGPPQPGFSPPPSTLQYTITGGTGAYAGASGQGMVTLQEMAGNSHSFFMTFTPTP